MIDWKSIGIGILAGYLLFKKEPEKKAYVGGVEDITFSEMKKNLVRWFGKPSESSKSEFRWYLPEDGTLILYKKKDGFIWGVELADYMGRFVFTGADFSKKQGYEESGFVSFEILHYLWGFFDKKNPANAVMKQLCEMTFSETKDWLLAMELASGQGYIKEALQIAKENNLM